MTRFTSLLLVAGLGLGMLGCAGCESSNTAPRQGHDAQFSAGSGEFGTTPAVAGDYPNDVSRTAPPTTQSTSR